MFDGHSWMLRYLLEASSFFTHPALSDVSGVNVFFLCGIRWLEIGTIIML